MRTSKHIFTDNPGFAKLVSGQAVSALGDWMATVAFMAVVHDLTGSPAAVGGILILRLAPGAVAAPLAGRLAHRLGRRRTMIAMDLARAGMAFSVPLMLELWWLYLWAFLLEVASLLFLPARDSSTPDLVQQDQIPIANGILLGASFGLVPVGAAVFALMAAVGTGGNPGDYVTPVFWVDAATFLVSMEMIRRIPELQLRQKTRAARPEADFAGRGFLASFKIPLVRSIIFPATAISLALGSLFSLGVVLVTEVMRASNTQFGVLIALFGVGAGLGLGVMHARRAQPSLAELRMAIAVLGAMIFTTVLSPFLALAFGGAIGFGAAAAYSMAAGMSILQQQLNADERVLAFAAFHTLIRVGLGVGALGAGAAGQLLQQTSLPLLGSLPSARVVLFFGGLVVLCSTLLVREAPAASHP
jgi:MFS family permease